MNDTFEGAMVRVAELLDAEADHLPAQASAGPVPDTIWFNIDAAIDEAIEAIDGEAGASNRCDIVGACVPAARAALRAGDVSQAVQALRDAAGIARNSRPA